MYHEESRFGKYNSLILLPENVGDSFLKRFRLTDLDLTGIGSVVLLENQPSFLTDFARLYVGLWA
jgi:hypothetical protein